MREEALPDKFAINDGGPWPLPRSSVGAAKSTPDAEVACGGQTGVIAQKVHSATPMPLPTVYSPERAAYYLGLYDLGVADPAGTLLRYVKKGMVEHVKIGGYIGFLRSQLDQFIETRRQRNGRGQAR